MCPQAQVHWQPQWRVPSMWAASKLKRPHRSSCPRDRFPNTWKTCSASKQEQPRSSCGRNDNTIHKPTEDKTWLQPWIGDSEACSLWFLQEGPKRLSSSWHTGEFTHTLRACLLSHFSPVQLCATLWGAACQARLSMGFSRQEYWSGIPCPPPGALPDPAIKLASLTSSALAGRFFPTSATWEAIIWRIYHKSLSYVFWTRTSVTKDSSVCGSESVLWHGLVL